MPKKRNKPIDAAQLMTELENDSDYQSRISAQDKKIEENNKKAKEEETKLIQDLEQIGIKVNSVWDLVNTSDGYDKAIPILLKHLEKQYGDKTKEGILRALTIPSARGIAGNILVKMFKVESNEETRWLIGNALRVVSDQENINSVIDILKDDSYGGSRDMLVHAIARLQGEKAIDLLLQLLDDSNVAPQAIIALGNLHSSEAALKIEKYLSHQDSWVRQQAKDALNKINK